MMMMKAPGKIGEGEGDTDDDDEGPGENRGGRR